MTRRCFPILTLLACGASACATETTEVGAHDQDLTEERDGSALSSEIASYSVVEVGSTLRMRWSLDGAPVVEGQAQGGVAPSLSGPRRYSLAAASPVPGGKPVVIAQFGRGQERIHTGDYDCGLGAEPEAVVVVRENEVADQLSTAVAGGAQRACKIHVESVQTMRQVLRDNPHAAALSFSSNARWVRGRFEATLGRAADATTREVRGAFGFIVTESNPY